MRYVALVLGIVGGLTSGFLGYKWYSDASDPVNKEKIEIVRAASLGPGATEELKAEVAELDKAIKASYFLLVALPLGIAGGILAFLRRGFSGAALMLLAVLGPAILNWRSLIFTCPLIVGAVFCFLVRPARAAQPEAA
jgi:hypothetical protein